MKFTLIAWFVFFGGLSVEMAIDHLLRRQDGIMNAGGIPEALWFLIHIALAIISMWLLFKGTISLKSIWMRLFAVFAQVAVAFVMYMFVLIYYAGGTGIDSL